MNTKVQENIGMNFFALEEGIEMLGNSSYRFYAYDDGTAFEGFEWLNIVEKL
jgi:hypothetical protein